MLTAFNTKLAVVIFIFILPRILFAQFIRFFDDTYLDAVYSSAAAGSGARAFGMGGAFIAVANDGTASSWNPAGIAQLKKAQLAAVYLINNFDLDFPGNRHSSSQTFDPKVIVTSADGPRRYSSSGNNLDFLSLAYPFSIGNYRLAFQFSYQRIITRSMHTQFRNVPYFYAAVTDYSQIRNQPAPDRFDFVEYIQYKSTGGYDAVSASTSIGLFSVFYFGIAFNHWFGTPQRTDVTNQTYVYTRYKDDDGDGIFFEQDILEYSVISKVDSRFRVSGQNLSLGVLIKPYPRISLGGVYKTQFTLGYERVENSIGESTLYNPPRTDISMRTESASIIYPFSTGLGIAYRPNNRLTLSSDYTFTKWSRAKYTNIRIVDEFGIDEREEGPFIRPDNNYDNKDAKQIRVGLEYVFGSDNWILPVRLGFFKNAQYLADSNGNSIAYLGYTLGTGLGISNHFYVDFAYISQNGKSSFGSNPYPSNAKRKFSSNHMYLTTRYSF